MNKLDIDRVLTNFIGQFELFIVQYTIGPTRGRLIRIHCIAKYLLIDDCRYTL